MTREEIAVNLAKDDGFKQLSPERQTAVFQEAVTRAEATPGQTSEPSGFHPLANTPIWQTLVTRPNAMYRSAVRGMLPGATETPGQGFLNATTAQGNDLIQRAGSVAPIQQNAIEAYYQKLAQNHPGVNPGVTDVLGGMIPSALGLAGETAANIATGPMDAIAALAPFTRAGQMAGQAIAESPIGQSVQQVLTKERQFPSIPKPLDFLRGNPEKIAKAETALDEAAYNAVARLRRSGDLHNPIFETLHREAATAWQPMKTVASAIPGTLGIDEVRASAEALPVMAENPTRLQALNMFLDDLASSSEYKLPRSGRPFSFTASDWSDLSSEIGTFMTRGGIRGKAAQTFSDMLKSDLRSAIADTIEAKAPDVMKGFVAEAKNNWADYAADRNRLFQLFQPGASRNEPTKAGVEFLKRAALGQLTTDERLFLDRIQGKAGIDLPKTIRPFAKALLKAKTSGKTGEKIGHLIPYGAAALTAEELWRRHR